MWKGARYGLPGLRVGVLWKCVHLIPGRGRLASHAAGWLRDDSRLRFPDRVAYPGSALGPRVFRPPMFNLFGGAQAERKPWRKREPGR